MRLSSDCKGRIKYLFSRDREIVQLGGVGQESLGVSQIVEDFAVQDRSRGKGGGGTGGGV